MINRRELILLSGGAMAVARPVLAQQKPIPVIGFLSGVSPGPYTPFVAAFRQGLSEAGFIDGRNLTIEYRWAEGHYDRLPELAAELVGRKVDAIAASGGGPATARAAKHATSTIPIVFVTGTDPVEDGLIASLAQPGGNLTGVSMMFVELTPKTAGAAFGAGSPGQGDGFAREPKECECRAPHARHAESSAREGDATPNRQGRQREGGRGRFCNSRPAADRRARYR
jgi:hypothetical protein